MVAAAVPASATPQKGFTEAPQTGGTLTVWVDSTRLAAAQLYQKEHPSVKMNIVTYDGDANGSNYLQTKVGLFNRTGSGWPDVVFSAQNNEVTWAVPAGFPAPLNKGLIPQSTLAGWATGANNAVPVNGTLYCLRNDLSQTVLWYNSALMKQWGYQVPTTWEQYQALGQKVAAAASRATWSARPVTPSPPRSSCGRASAAPTRSPARRPSPSTPPARSAPGWPRCWTP